MAAPTDLGRIGPELPAWIDELESDAVVRDLRLRMKQAFAAEPELAAAFRRPLLTDEPEHEILERCRAGEFRG